jgi:hypothetical protein
MIQNCRVCARCGAVWPEQCKRQLVPAWPSAEEHVSR